MAERIPQSTTIRVPLQVYLKSDGFSAATGKTLAVTISINGAAYGNPSGGATNAIEIGSGSYYVDLSTTDTGTLGPLFVKAAVASVDDVIVIYNVVKATNGGLSALPDVAVDSTAAANLAKTTRAIGRGTVTTGASTTSVPTSACTPAGAVADQFKGRVILFDADTTTTALRGQAAAISASSNAAAPTFTVAALTTAPASGDTFSVI